MKKYILFLVSIICVLTMIGCSKKGNYETENAVPGNSVEENQTLEEAESTVTSQISDEAESTELPETVESIIIEPLPTTIDLNNIKDCTLAVSIGCGDICALKSDNTKYAMKAKVYDYEVFDLVDISLLNVGSIIAINKEQIEISSIEINELGTVIINGGLDVGGYELITNEDGVYYSVGYSDIKTYYEIGEAELELAPEFVYIDGSDLDNEEKKYTLGDLSAIDVISGYEGTPHNTSIVVEDGFVTLMRKIYTP